MTTPNPNVHLPTAPVAFAKMNGAGNDFILIDNRPGEIGPEAAELARRVCHRRLAVGADGLILIESSATVDFAWRFFNSDGSLAEMCGNGARCAARFAYLNGIAGSKMQFETLAGVIRAEMRGDEVAIRITPPALAAKEGARLYAVVIGDAPASQASELETMSAQSGGRYFRAGDASVLAEVYDAIDRLEKSPQRPPAMTVKEYYYIYPLFAGFLTLLLYVYRRNRRVS